jgi:type IV pilus assembly protein PilM
MARSFPPDVVVLDHDSLTHARFGRGKANPRIVNAKTFRLAGDTFTSGAVTPQLSNEASLAETLRRLRNETGKWDKVSLLLPDAWFRMNIVDLPSLPDRPAEAIDVVRWSLKRTLPIPPEQMRVNYVVLSRGAGGARVLVLSAFDATLTAIEKQFTAAGFDIVLIEPLGLNIWNAVTVREGETTADRLFIYLRDTDFTTAVFRGAQPLFIRSRNLSGDRTIDQEIRLSANYLRDSLNVETFASCYVAGDGATAIQATLAEEFQSQVRPLVLRDYVEDIPSGLTGPQGIDDRHAELIACAGVFTG